MSRVKQVREGASYVDFIILRDDTFDVRAIQRLSRAEGLPTGVIVDLKGPVKRVGPFYDARLSREWNAKINSRSQSLRHRAQRRTRNRIAA